MERKLTLMLPAMARMVLNCVIWQYCRAARHMKALSRELQALIPNLQMGYVCAEQTVLSAPM